MIRLPECHRHPDISDTCPHARAIPIPGSEARDEVDDVFVSCGVGGECDQPASLDEECERDE